MTASSSPRSSRSRLASPQRRRLLGAAGAGSAALALGALSTLSFAGNAGAGGNRFVLVILRGGMDGLGAAPAMGDPDFAAARGPLAQYASPPAAARRHALAAPELGRAARDGTAAAKPASFTRSAWPIANARTSMPSKCSRAAALRPYELATGWLGRALAASGSRKASRSIPPCRWCCAARAASTPGRRRHCPIRRPTWSLGVERMYAGDPALAAALERARALHLERRRCRTARTAWPRYGRAPARFAASRIAPPTFLGQASGPQAAVLEIGGWDTHVNQVNANGPLGNGLRQLDAGLAALRSGLLEGGAWNRTVVVVASEFGRDGGRSTARSAPTMAPAASPSSSAGRTSARRADWPGLGRAQRFEGRDLRVTTDLRAVLKGVLADHLEVATKTLDDEVFPGGAAIRKLSLLRT